MSHIDEDDEEFEWDGTADDEIEAAERILRRMVAASMSGPTTRTFAAAVGLLLARRHGVVLQAPEPIIQVGFEPNEDETCHFVLPRGGKITRVVGYPVADILPAMRRGFELLFDPARTLDPADCANEALHIPTVNRGPGGRARDFTGGLGAMSSGKCGRREVSAPTDRSASVHGAARRRARGIGGRSKSNTGTRDRPWKSGPLPLSEAHHSIACRLSGDRTFSPRDRTSVLPREKNVPSQKLPFPGVRWRVMSRNWSGKIWKSPSSVST